LWSDQANAFATIKERLCSTPMLALPDFNKTFEIECELSGAALNDPTYDKELYALVRALET